MISLEEQRLIKNDDENINYARRDRLENSGTDDFESQLNSQSDSQLNSQQVTDQLNNQLDYQFIEIDDEMESMMKLGLPVNFKSKIELRSGMRNDRAKRNESKKQKHLQEKQKKIYKVLN